MTRASAEGGEARFRISWERGTYKVSIPNYQGGEVVRADVVDELCKALNRAAELLEAAGKAISDDGYDMDFTHVDGIETDHIGFSIDCENAVHVARASVAKATGEQP